MFEGIGELDVHPDVVPAIRGLAERGLRLVTLSVGGTEVAERLLERAGIRDLFEATLSAVEAGRWKPHETPYRYALDRCGVPAAEALLVAVHPWDIDGAHRAGLRTAWVDRDGTRYPGYFATPDLVVDSPRGPRRAPLRRRKRANSVGCRPMIQRISLGLSYSTVRVRGVGESTSTPPEEKFR